MNPPTRWQLAGAAGGRSPADQLIRPDGDTTLMIQEAVETCRDVQAFVDDARRLQTDDHLDIGAVRSLVVAGVETLEWDATLRSSSEPIRSRTGVFERLAVPLSTGPVHPPGTMERP
jgi:hypothetical protein